MTDAIDLTNEQRKQLTALLRRFLPGVTIWAYGSRVKWTARPNSDLDLVAFTTPEQRAQVADLKDALAESNLPFPVDLHVWDEVPERFREIIRKDYVVVREAKEPDSQRGSAGEWPRLSLREAHVKLIDCDHRTPPAAEVGYPYVAIPQLRNGRIDLSEARRISHQHFTDWTRKALPAPNDVVLSRRCNPGETAFVPPGLEFALGQNLVLLRADGLKVYPPFLRWLVRGPEWWEQIGKFLNVGAVFDSLKCADVPNFELHIPPLPEQRAIAHILGTLDDKIELNRKMNETLEAMARALFKSWFIDFDPVRAKVEGRAPGLPKAVADLFPDSFEDSELGEIPKGWAVGCVDDEFDLTMGQSPPGETYNEAGEGVPFYQGRTDFGFRFPTRRVYCTAPTRLARKGDTLISVRAPVGDINMAAEDCAIGRGVAAARHKSGSRSYSYQFMRSQAEVFARFEAEGTVFGSIGKKDFHAISCVAPPRDLVIEFERRLEMVDSRIEAMAQETLTLSALRDTLLPKLISGGLRVKNVKQLLERVDV